MSLTNLQKNFFTVILPIGIGLLALFFYIKSCRQTDPQVVVVNKTIDSLKHKITSDSTEYYARQSQDSSVITGLLKDRDLLETRYEIAKGKVNFTSKQLTDLNSRYKSVKATLDTLKQLATCDSLSHAIDSLQQALWNAERTVDSLLFVNDNLKNVEDSAYKRCAIQLASVYNAMHSLDSLNSQQVKADQKLIQQTKKHAKKVEIIAEGFSAFMAFIATLVGIKK